MTIYARSDVHGLTRSDGCGQTHRAEPGKDFVVDCPPCEASVRADKRISLLFSQDPYNVPLTAAERKVRQRMLEQRARITAEKELQKEQVAEADVSPAAVRDEAQRAAQGRSVDDPPSQDPAGDGEDPPDLSKLHVKTLQKMARDAGVDDTGTKDELIARLAPPSE